MTTIVVTCSTVATVYPIAAINYGSTVTVTVEAIVTVLLCLFYNDQSLLLLLLCLSLLFTVAVR